MRTRRLTGLSIIELLVVIAIFGILAGLAANSWTGYRNQQTVIEQSVLLAGIIDQAKTTARTTSTTVVLTVDTSTKEVAITSNGTLVARKILNPLVSFQFLKRALPSSPATPVTPGVINFLGPYGAADPADVPAQIVLTLGGHVRKLRVVGLGAKVVLDGA